MWAIWTFLTIKALEIDPKTKEALEKMGVSVKMRQKQGRTELEYNLKKKEAEKQIKENFSL